MEIKGAYRIVAPRAAVWAALNDPDILRKCLPGCEKLQKESDTAFAATLKAKVGPVSAKFSGAVALLDLDPPNGYRIVGEGKGGIAGFAKGSAKVTLREDQGMTILAYDAQAQVGGKLAQIGSRLVLGTARKLADDFFKTFADMVAPGSGAEKLALPAKEPTS
jgi:carbon monoxide dehydrogenase subunit G